MTTYLALNIVMIVIIFSFTETRLIHYRNTPFKRLGLVLASLLVMTAVFDSIIVGLDIVGYDPRKILGIFIGRAPLEDFAYPLVAAFLVPRLWHHFSIRSQRKAHGAQNISQSYRQERNR